MDSIFGLVLCGGASRRMGTDKGALSLGGQTLVERASGTLAELGVSVGLSTGAASRYADLGHDVILDAPADFNMGPAAGLCAGLAHARATGKSWVLTLACDMPNVESPALAGLLEHARANALDACLFEHDGRIEPLLAVYHVRALGPARRALAAGRARMIDFHRGFGTLAVGRWSHESAPSAQSWAVNVNTPSEWRAVCDREPTIGDPS